MKRFALAALAAILISPAFAATGTAALAATAPTTYTDGSALAPASIVGYALDCQFTPTGATTSTACIATPTSITGASPNTTVTLTYPADTGGKACWRWATKTAAVTGPFSTAACKDVPALTPSPPSGGVVTITLALTLTSASPITVAMAAPIIERK